MLSTRAHCLGKNKKANARDDDNDDDDDDDKEGNCSDSYKVIHNKDFTQDIISLQQVMEYCLGSASDLLEGEFQTLNLVVSFEVYPCGFFFLIYNAAAECISPSSQETSTRS